MISETITLAFTNPRTIATQACGDTEFESKTAIWKNPIKHVFYKLLAISGYAASACKDM